MRIDRSRPSIAWSLPETSCRPHRSRLQPARKAWKGGFHPPSVIRLIDPSQAVDFFAVDFLAVDFFAVDFLAVDFLAAGMAHPLSCRLVGGRHRRAAQAVEDGKRWVPSRPRHRSRRGTPVVTTPFA